jgi:PPOX class probable F420-dependent enzyme
MSEPSHPIIPASHLNLLASTALANVATTGPDGAPQVNPVWFLWDGAHLRFGGTLTRQKIRNLRRDPRIAVAIVDPANPQRYLELRGAAVAIEADPDRTLIRALVRKYLGTDVVPDAIAASGHVAVTVEPRHATYMG